MRDGTRRLIYWSTLALLALPVLIAAGRNLALLAHAVGDQAIIELNAGDIPSRLPLIGAYSRLEFHHPGPMLYYLVAPAVRLLGSPGMVLTAAAISIASMGGLLVVFLRRGGQALFVLGAAFTILLTRSMGLDVLSMWNPYVLVLPFALAVALTWSVWCREWSALPWLALVGSFVGQAHLGLAPAVAFLFASSVASVVIAAVRDRRRREPAISDGEADDVSDHGADHAAGLRRPLIVSAVILVIAWFPPLLEQLTGHPGNITRIIDAGSSAASGQHLGLTRALGLLGLLLGRVDPLGFNSTADLRILESLDDGSIWWLAVPLLALIVSAVVARRRHLDDQLRLTGLLFGLLAVTVVALSAITGLPYLYLERWVVVIAVFIWLNLLWTLLSAIVDQLDRRELLSFDPARRRRSLLLGSLAAVLLLLIALVPLAETPGHANDVDGSAAIDELLTPVRSVIADCTLVAVAPSGGPAGLLVASGLVAQLHRDGFDVVIDDLFAFSHGEQHSLRGRTANCTVLVGPAPEPGQSPAQAGAIIAVQAESEGLSVWLVR